MSDYKTPGVYVDEGSLLPPSIAPVETAIPIFIGYTEKSIDNLDSKIGKTAVRIKSILEYTNLFGGPKNELPTFKIKKNGKIKGNVPHSPKYKMYHALQVYFGNGGGPCYIMSVAHYDVPLKPKYLLEGLESAKNFDEPTIIVFPDAMSLSNKKGLYKIYKKALKQCAELGDRVLILDVLEKENGSNSITDSSQSFRDNIGSKNLKYGAAYYPFLQTSLTFGIDENQIEVLILEKNVKLKLTDEEIALDNGLSEMSLFHMEEGKYILKYHEIKERIQEQGLLLPPSAIIAGIYVKTDKSRGVWKAPANVGLNLVTKPNVLISDTAQDDLNVDVIAGKSINAIRYFSGRGTLVWGARTLAGNDNDWRYISVRRFFNMVEESVRKATATFVFEPNDANTWVKIKAMIENFLTVLWRDGALQGAKPEHAFYVKVGQGETMTEVDISKGLLIVEIGMAVVRPAEFIVLKISYNMIT